MAVPVNQQPVGSDINPRGNAMKKMTIMAALIAPSVAGSMAGTAVLAERDHGFFGFGGGRDHGEGPREDAAGGKGGLLGRLMPDFAALDADANGQITTEELAAVVASRLATADTNTDGGLSAAEIVAQIEARRAEMIAARARRMIEEQDANADGLLQADEMAEGRGPHPAGIFAMLRRTSCVR